MAFGYEGCSMTRIAKVAGSTKPTIYRLYPSKALLFKVVITKAIQETSGRTPDLSEDSRPPAVVLNEVAQRIREVRASGLPRLWQAAVAVKEKFPDIYAEVLEIVGQRTIARRLSAYFADLDRRGELSIANPGLAAHNFALLMGPASEILHMVHEQHTESERAEEVVQLFLKGYASPSG